MLPVCGRASRASDRAPPPCERARPVQHAVLTALPSSSCTLCSSCAVCSRSAWTACIKQPTTMQSSISDFTTTSVPPSGESVYAVLSNQRCRLLSHFEYTPLSRCYVPAPLHEQDTIKKTGSIKVFAKQSKEDQATTIDNMCKYFGKVQTSGSRQRQTGKQTCTQTWSS